MLKALVFSFVIIFSISSFSATLTIRSQHELQDVNQAPIEKTNKDEFGRLKLTSFSPRVGCLINKETAKQSGYSLGELQIFASMGNAEIICRTMGNNEWGDYIATGIEVVTRK